MTARNERAKMQFLTWVRETHPALFQAALARAGEQTAINQLAGLGEGDSTWSKILGGITTLGATYLGLRNQRDLMKINLDRAQAGLPPVNAADVTAPVVQTRIDLPPELIAKLGSEAGTQVNKVLMFGGLALAAVLIFTMMRKK